MLLSVFVEQFHLWRLPSPPPAEFSQFIKTGRTLSDVVQYRGGMISLRRGGKFFKGGASGTVDASRVGIIFMHNPIEGIQ